MDFELIKPFFKSYRNLVYLCANHDTYMVDAEMEGRNITRFWVFPGKQKLLEEDSVTVFVDPTRSGDGLFIGRNVSIEPWLGTGTP